MEKSTKNVEESEKVSSEVDTEAVSGDGVEESDDLLPPSEILNDVLNHVPKEQRKVILQRFQMGVSHTESPTDLIVKKVSSEHISKILDNSRDEMERDYEERKQQKIFVAVLTIVGLVFLVIITGMLKDQPDLLEKLVFGIIGFVGGAAGGYGFGKSRRDD